MNSEYHKWWSSNLNQDMELKVYGYYGKPVLVFPAQSGRLYDFENFGMLDVISSFIEQGKLKVFTVDGLDDQSWANWDAHPADRARRHLDYDRYITDEVAPFINQHCNHSGQKILTTGVSMGGYHAANFFFRHPEIFDSLIAISGIYSANAKKIIENGRFRTGLPALNSKVAWAPYFWPKLSGTEILGAACHFFCFFRDA